MNDAQKEAIKAGIRRDGPRMAAKYLRELGYDDLAAEVPAVVAEMDADDKKAPTEKPS